MEYPVKVDSRKIKALREARAWSQEQLAHAAGLSVRTVQRAENEGSASRESKVCLAAALGVDHAEPGPGNGPAVAVSDGIQMARATALAFTCSGLLMLALLLLSGGGQDSPVFWIGGALVIVGAAFGFVAIVLTRRQGNSA